MARLLVIGSSNTDLTVRLRQLPAPGQTVLGGELLTGPGGKGANQAVAAARAGADVVVVTGVGDDAFGRIALDAYRHEGIDISHTRTIAGVASGVALIFVDDDGENMIGVASGANAGLVEADVDRLPDALFARGSVLLLAGLEIPLAVAHRAALRAHDAGIRVILNPAPLDSTLLESGILKVTDVLTPNRVELSQLTGRTVETRDEASSACEWLQARWPGRLHIVVTLGALGCLVQNADGSVHAIPGYSVRAVDTVGAGDAFNGALAVAQAEGRSLLEAASWANAAAALAITLPGAQSALPTRDEIDRLARSPRWA
jgi:ribokinase